MTHMQDFQNTNFNSLIRELCINPFLKSKRFIFLDWVILLPLSRPILKEDFVRALASCNATLRNYFKAIMNMRGVALLLCQPSIS